MDYRTYNESIQLLRPDNDGERAWGCLRCQTIIGHHGTIAMTTASWADSLRAVYPGVKIIKSTDGYDICPFCLGDQWDELRIGWPRFV